MRQQLGRFGLSGHHHLQPITKLSGGQKARACSSHMHPEGFRNATHQSLPCLCSDYFALLRTSIPQANSAVAAAPLPCDVVAHACCPCSRSPKIPAMTL
jgi:hypothetical protein